jgi:tRNA A64-2'-O-ribosylphosphate transferase
MCKYNCIRIVFVSTLFNIINSGVDRRTTLRLQLVATNTKHSSWTIGNWEVNQRLSLAKKRRHSDRQLHPLCDVMSDIRNRLLSIHYDIEEFVKPLLVQYAQYPVVANERCGTWYAHPFQKATCYFKSTDGHVGTWNFSLKRLNLPLLQIASKRGGCLILDSSVRKELPDSLSRTIPIWACVMNRIVARFREDLNLPPLKTWDMTLHTPSWIVSNDEHELICRILDDRVESLYASGAIVNPQKLVKTLNKPLRPYWITPDRRELEIDADLGYYAIVCMSCSKQQSPPTELNFEYIPGAGDDDESWSRKLTPRLFWENLHAILGGALDDGCRSMVDVDTVVDGVVQARDRRENNEPREFSCDAIGATGIFIGTRRVGRPPDCWNDFDVVLAVTELEYDEMKENVPDGKYYLQLPVEEGKRDRTELERWMAVGIAFVALNRNKRILIHCAQGKDRSVTVALACIALLTELKHPLTFRPEVERLSQDSLDEFLHEGNFISGSDESYGYSGLSYDLVQALKGRSGRDLVLNWLRKELVLPAGDLANKDTLRVALHLVQQYREKASPSRSSMQKLNRFFMSAQYLR